MSGPLLSGFNPDPSIVRVGDAYYLVTSTFEYLPGLPVYRSTDLLAWELVGHVITRPAQAELEDVPTPGGVWAPTIRHRDGVFHVIVTIMMGGRGCVVYTATDPAGPWSDGVTVPAVTGIDPDLAWDDDGAAYVTFADFPRELQQVRVDLATGEALGPVTPVWAGSGLYAPEGPHLYRRGDWWYLLAAEGGTDRGHAVTVARSTSPDGPFESSPDNPVISARSTGNPVQNVGHADLVTTDDGDAMVLLGVRPVGLAQAFSPLGRETFLADVEWVDGWPTATLRDVPASDPGIDWIAVRRVPEEVGVPVDGSVSITADGRGMDDPRPWFVGRRQAQLGATFSAVVDASAGTGGVAARHDEQHFLTVDASGSTV
ncbi:glycoside hydrolase family 43 protein, partial [Nocardioides hankookensis]